MKIGIDLDGVCYGFSEAFCEYVGAPSDFVATKWRFFEDLGFSTDQFLLLCRNALLQGQLFRHGYLLPGTKEAFDALIDAGHEIHLVTDRCSIAPDLEPLIIETTRLWLDDNGLGYRSIHFTGDKDTIVKELELDAFLDDKTENYDMVEQHCRAYVFDQPWNREAFYARRVKGWTEFIEDIGEFAAHERSQDAVDGMAEWELAPGEVRVTSETGGQKGQKLARIGSLDPQALMAVAKVAGFGEQKYSRLNYLNGYDWSLSYDACQRHLHAFWSGEDNDPESGLPHLAHAAWHCLAMLAFLQHGLGTDDRYRKPEPELTSDELFKMFGLDGDAA